MHCPRAPPACSLDARRSSSYSAASLSPSPHSTEPRNTQEKAPFHSLPPSSPLPVERSSSSPPATKSSSSPFISCSSVSSACRSHPSIFSSSSAAEIRERGHAVTPRERVLGATPSPYRRRRFAVSTISDHRWPRSFEITSASSSGARIHQQHADPCTDEGDRRRPLSPPSAAVVSRFPLLRSSRRRRPEAFPPPPETIAAARARRHSSASSDRSVSSLELPVCRIALHPDQIAPLAPHACSSRAPPPLPAVAGDRPVTIFNKTITSVCAATSSSFLVLSPTAETQPFAVADGSSLPRRPLLPGHRQVGPARWKRRKRKEMGK